MMSSWSSWSPCSASCGRGSTMRLRNYLKKGLELKCKSQLVETKSCVISEKCLDESLLSAQERKSYFFFVNSQFK